MHQQVLLLHVVCAESVQATELSIPEQSCGFLWLQSPSVVLLQFCVSTCGGHQLVSSHIMEACALNCVWRGLRIMSDDDHGALGPEMPSGSDGPAIGPEDTQGLVHFPLPPDDWHAQFFSDFPSWLADYEPRDEALSGSDDSMWSPSPSPRYGPARANGGHMDTLTVYHVYRWSGVHVSDMYATTNESPPFGPGNPGRRVLIDDVLQIWYCFNDPKELIKGRPWHPRPVSIARFRMTAAVLRQPDNCWMNFLEIWLLMTLMDMEALVQLRACCRQAYHRWVTIDPTLVRLWLRQCLKTFVHTSRNRRWVKCMERHSSWLVLQDDLEPEARELGIAYTQYRIPGCRRTYFHRNEHFSLNRATVQMPWSEGTRGRRVRLPSREREPSTASESLEGLEERHEALAFRERNRPHTWQDWSQQMEQDSDGD